MIFGLELVKFGLGQAQVKFFHICQSILAEFDKKLQGVGDSWMVE